MSLGLYLAVLEAFLKGSRLSPQLSTSMNYMYWVSVEDFIRCTDCKEIHGKIWRASKEPDPGPPLHLNCRCFIRLMETIAAGTATINGTNGADWTLKYQGALPEYYVDKSAAYRSRWKRGKWPSNFLSEGKMITKGIYQNRNDHLPQKDGRIWYEADINYTAGRRNKQRVLWSNDGLIFVTYDHYETFYEIV